MTESDKATFRARLKHAEEDAAKRGLRLTGYVVDGDRISYSAEPAKRTRAPRAEPVVRNKMRRGGLPAQGALL